MKFELTDVERLILANQYQLFSKLADNEYEQEQNNRIASQLRNGHKWLYQEIFEHIHENMPDKAAEFVVSVLSMYRALLSSYRVLEDKSGLDEKDLAFKGFDGNNEGSLMFFAEAISDANRFSDVLINEYLNSHTPMAHTYREMLDKWIAFGRSHELSKDQIAEIIE